MHGLQEFPKVELPRDNSWDGIVGQREELAREGCGDGEVVE